jgi:hypothetical protein
MMLDAKRLDLNSRRNGVCSDSYFHDFNPKGSKARKVTDDFKVAAGKAQLLGKECKVRWAGLKLIRQGRRVGGSDRPGRAGT